MDTSLRIVTGPAVEPLNDSTIRAHCKIDNLDDTELLALYLTSARMLAEEFLNRALITQTLAWTIAPSHGGAPRSHDYRHQGHRRDDPRLWGREIELPRPPFRSLTSVTVRNWDGSDTVLDAAQYVLQGEVDPARIILQPTVPPAQPIQRVAIVFTAGYGDGSGNPMAIPQPIRHAILLTVAAMYEHRGDAGDLPDAAQALLEPYRVVSFGV